MPRPRADQISVVTPELLAMVWDNENQMRMWLRRRGATAAALRCSVVPAYGEGAERELEPVIGVRLEPDAAPVAPGSAVEMPNDVIVATDQGVAALPAASFDAYADAVDELLDAEQEDPEQDANVRPFFDSKLPPADAVAAIIAKRAHALGEAVSPASVVAETARQVAQAPHKDTKPAPVPVAPVARPESLIEIGPMPTEAALMWAAQIAKLCKLSSRVRELGTDRVVGQLDALKPRKGAKPADAPAAGPGRAKVNHWPAVSALLERPDGASVHEVQAACGWRTPPGKWFFEKWAAEHDRAADLVDLGNVEGVRRFKLNPARR